jgi:hypothetical protein
MGFVFWTLSWIVLEGSYPCRCLKCSQFTCMSENKVREKEEWPNECITGKEEENSYLQNSQPAACQEEPLVCKHPHESIRQSNREEASQTTGYCKQKSASRKPNVKQWGSISMQLLLLIQQQHADNKKAHYLYLSLTLSTITKYNAYKKIISSNNLNRWVKSALTSRLVYIWNI